MYTTVWTSTTSFIHVYISSAPSPPRMLTVTGTPTGSTVELNWLPPLHPNGAIHYEIEYEPAMTLGDPVITGHSSSPYFTLTLPSYTVRVRAVNSKGSATSGDLVVNPGKSRICVCYTRNYNAYVCYSRKCHHCICIIYIQLTISCEIIYESHIMHECTMTFTALRFHICNYLIMFGIIALIAMDFC